MNISNQSPKTATFFWSWLLVGLLALPLASSFVGSVRAVEPAVEATAAEPAEPERPLRFGAVGYLKAKTRDSVEPLVNYLSLKLGRDIHLVMYPSYNDVLVALAEPSIDLGLLSPVVFLQAKGALDIKPIANTFYPSGNFTYKAVILSRKDDPSVKTLADLVGKLVGFVDLFSASGYVVPKLMIEQAGVGAKNVNDKLFGNHTDAIAALESGEVSAAATYDLVFRHLGDTTRSIADYHVLAESDPIPSDAVVASSRVDDALVKRIQDELLRFYAYSADLPEYDGYIYPGFIPPDPSLYTSLRAIHDKVMGPIE